MHVVALVSGGKDSAFAMLEVVRHGHTLVALANLHPPPLEAGESQDMDSFMYQTVGFEAIAAYGECMGLPVFRRALAGGSVNRDLQYEPTATDEVEDLYELLRAVKEAHPEVDAVCSGAIFSDYQRTRVENVCGRLGLISLAPLWRRDQRTLLADMIASEIDAVLIKVAAIGLAPNRDLNVSIADHQDRLCSLADEYGINECGEGGEYESFVRDCPLFVRSLRLVDPAVVMVTDDMFAPVGYLAINEFAVDEKGTDAVAATRSRLVDEWEAEPTRAQQLDADHGGDGACVVVRYLVDWSAAFGKPDGLDEDGDRVSVSVSGGPEAGALFVSARSHGSGESNAAGDQTEALLQAAEAAFATSGGTAEGTVFAATAASTHIFCPALEAFGEINGVYGTRFPIEPPARSTVELGAPSLSLDVLCLPRLRSTGVAYGRLHVQSISSWAPANIGPYSQAVEAPGGLVVLAGQIGLLPATMTLVDPTSARRQYAQCVDNIGAVLGAVRSSTDDVVMVTTFATNATAARGASRCEDNKLAPPGLPEVFVQVPRLPKDAVVELEVVAAQPSWGKVTETRRSGRAPVDGCSEGMVAEAWTVRFASTYGGGSAVLAVLEIGSGADVDTVEVGDEAVAAVVDRIVAFVHEAIGGESPSYAAMLRVYVAADGLEPAAAVAGLEHSLAERIGSAAAVSVFGSEQVAVADPGGGSTDRPNALIVATLAAFESISERPATE